MEGIKRSKMDRSKELLRIGLNERNRLTCDESLLQLFLFHLYARTVGRIWKCWWAQQSDLVVRDIQDGKDR